MNIVSTEIQDYAERFTSAESEILTELRQKTLGERADNSMLSGFYQGRLLSIFSKMINPRRILEIGTYVGYSTLCLAEGLSEDGKIITLDIQPETNRVAKEFWAKSGLNDKIESHLGDALEIIPNINEIYDLIFIDADKPNYRNYFELVFPKLRIGGFIIADNVLWSGNVLDVKANNDESTIALHAFNQKIQKDERVSNILFAVRDGLMITRKEKN
ncbi:MAG: O-methyltransferase [Acidobacteriota bacterium]|jgi:predicted O-methyltransferase YrrM|nr:O-methyltransferase [Acidobacteriota bacterium]MDQ3373114.1 O-methyltransferase [Acidobacteriota bacterium]